MHVVWICEKKGSREFCLSRLENSPRLCGGLKHQLKPKINKRMTLGGGEGRGGEEEEEGRRQGEGQAEYIEFHPGES